MSIGLHDPRLTAYALGELTGAEKTEVENALAKSPALRQAVDEIRQTGEAITLALEEDSPAGLTEEQVATITRRAESNLPAKPFWASLAALSAAACVLLAFFLIRADWSETPLRDEAAQQVAGTPAARTSVDTSEPSQSAASNPTATAANPTDSDAENHFAAKYSRPKIPQTPPRPAGLDAKARAAVDKPDPTGEHSSQAIITEVVPRPALPPAPALVAGTAATASTQPPSSATAQLAAPSSPAKGTGRVAGEVLDESGAVLPGAIVELKQLAGGQTWTTVSRDDGSFAFADLPSGPAELKASLEGFRSSSNRLQLQGSAVRVDPVLSVGQVAEMVTVTSSEPLIAASESSIGEAGQGYSNRPLNGRVEFERPAPPERAMNVADAPDSAEPEFNTENYARVEENPFRLVMQHPLSTFSIDVDTASYSNVRRFINEGSLPPADAVRIEEMVNYFSYDYPQPVGRHPFSVTTEAAEAPWNPQHLLVRIGLKGRELSRRDRPVSNLVFLIDVSGSMDTPNKLPLLTRAMKLLVERLTEKDRVAIVVYAGSSGVALPSTRGDQKVSIQEALDSLTAGGSTHGSAGIRKAYEIARKNFVKGGVNRVILATDGDFNVGTTSQGELIRLIEDEAKSGVFLSVLGFGMGNLKDATLEGLADKGNGNYGYIDTINEARKLLVDQMDGTLVTIAKDVKIQVEFNPAQVSGYRLIGYENRSLRDEDFNDDRKDAGEIGAGHSVTALYELVPVGAPVDAVAVDALKYQRPPSVDGRFAHELMTVKLRYKNPDEDNSQLIEMPVVDEGRRLAAASDDFKFAAAVAAFGMVLRHSEQSGNATFSSALSLAQQGLGPDRFGYRREFIDLVREAQRLAR